MAVVRWAETALSVASSRGPYRSMVLRRISGVMFSAGCRARLSSRTTRCRAAMPGSVVNSSAAPIWPAASACRVSGPPVSVGHEGLEPQPVDPLQAEQAISPFLAFGRAPEHQARCHFEQVGDGPQVIAGGRRRGNHDRVGVLGRGGLCCHQAAALRRPRQRPVGRRRIGRGGQPPEAQEIQRRTRVFGNKLDQPIHEGRVHELTGAQIRHDPDRETLSGERARVNVSEQNALGKVK